MEIEKIRVDNNSDVIDALVLNRKPDSDTKVRIIAVGDIGFSGGVRKTYEKNNNFEQIFSEIKPLFETGDLLFGNLETPLINNSLTTQLFAGDPFAVTSLKSTGFSLIHLANNHALDYGVSGISSTIDLLKLNGIIPLGVGETKDEAKKVITLSVNGIRIGWLGCGRTHIEQKNNNPVYWEFDEKELLDQVRISKPQVDILVVSIHTGLMYLDYPKPDLKVFVEKLFDEGADLILMHHAHVLQSVQVHRDGSICCYNLGNFVLDWQEGNVEVPILQQEQNESAIFIFDVGREGIINAFSAPTFIDQHYIVRWAREEKGERILNRLINISRDIQNDYSKQFEAQRIERNAGPILKVISFHIKNKNWKYIRELIKNFRFEHLIMFIRYFTSSLFRTKNK